MVNLIEKRHEKGLSQIQLAEKSGVKRTTIAAIEIRQNKCPSMENAKKLAAVLDISWTEFYE